MNKRTLLALLLLSAIAPISAMSFLEDEDAEEATEQIVPGQQQPRRIQNNIFSTVEDFDTQDEQ